MKEVSFWVWFSAVGWFMSSWGWHRAANHRAECDRLRKLVGVAIITSLWSRLRAKEGE